MASHKRMLMTGLRALVTIAAIYIAFRQVPVANLLPLLTQLDPLLVLLAILLLHAAQWFSALRTRYYLQEQTIALQIKPSLQLHYVGGLFNALLPGGTGGDAYKAWWLKRYKQGSLVHLVKLMIAGRLNGLWALSVILCLFAGTSPILRAMVPDATLLAMAALLIGSLAYHFLAHLLLKEPVTRQYHAGLYSFALQFCIVLCAWSLCAALHISVHLPEYIMLFLLSCILAMLPISIGGVGVRELALLHGSQWLGLSMEQGVASALAFSLINLTIPLAGAVIYSVWKPADKIRDSAA